VLDILCEVDEALAGFEFGEFVFSLAVAGILSDAEEQGL